MPPEEIAPGVFILYKEDKARLATMSTDPVPVYKERIQDGYRLWDPHRSKLAALILKGSGQALPLKSDSKVLYLGAATGTTVSHVSDIVPNGLVYAVEFSSRAMRDVGCVSGAITSSHPRRCCKARGVCRSSRAS